MIVFDLCIDHETRVASYIVPTLPRKGDEIVIEEDGEELLLEVTGVRHVLFDDAVLPDIYVNTRRVN